MSAASDPNAASALRFVPLSYNVADSQASALRLLFALFPDWETDEGEIKFTRFTDGITNTLLKATKRRPGRTDIEIDDDAVLLRAYGRSTEILIDRERETNSHLTLSRLNLAPPLLARFKNGMMYRFIRGQPCTSEDLAREPIWRGVARRLGQWHAVLPVKGTPDSAPASSPDGISMPTREPTHSLQEINAITPNKLTPNIWTVTQKWIFALPENTPARKERKALLQRELERIVSELVDLPGLGYDGLVLSHCDLLSGNVIVHPSSTHPDPSTTSNGSANGPTPLDTETVSFIDYEYCTPGPAAFDLANHFSEWVGFECNYACVPTRSVRKAFLQSYLASYTAHLPKEDTPKLDASTAEQQLAQLFDAVDRFRGIPGFYWGVWALIQAEISQIDFDYATYAEQRLGEYWAWRGEGGGRDQSRLREGGVREGRWAEE